MRCDLCSRNTQCMCKGGGCTGCHQSNPQVEYTNKILKLGIDAEIVKSNFDLIHKAQAAKVPPYNIWNKLANGVELSEELIEAINNPKKPYKQPVKNNKFVGSSDADGFKSIGPNPNIYCEFPSKTNIWDRCIYCNSIRRYIKGHVCPAFNGNQPK